MAFGRACGWKVREGERWAIVTCRHPGVVVGTFDVTERITWPDTRGVDRKSPRTRATWERKI